MTNVLEQKINSSNIPIELPMKRFSVLSHIDNIDYCLKQLNIYSRNGNYVIGYWLQKSAMGTMEILYGILPLEKADDLQREHPKNFEYFTLDKLLEEKKDYESGKYKVRDGHFVGLNPSYFN